MNTPKNSRAGDLALRTAFGGIVSALGVLLMYLGAVLDILDISAAAFASLMLVAVITEFGRREALCVFSVTAILSWLLLPNRMPALIYTVFLGYYPILKPTLERLKRVARLTVKLVILNAAVTVSLFAARFLFAPEAESILLTLIFYPLVNAAFLLYDIALTQMTNLWVFKLRRTLGLGKRRR